ncbi:MAG: calcineurin-like phosphoesterase C-terminal domain-containing protein, partial [Cyclobacteriaceae bacterium]
GDDLDLFSPYQQAIKKIGVPWYNVLGNHDLNFDANADTLSDETFEAHFGPANYAFNYGKVHFIVLDDILYPDPRDQRGYWGGFRQDQLDFVKNNLQYVPTDHLVVLAFHIPISELNGDSFRDEDRQKLFQLLKDYPYTLSLSAHTHLQKQDFFNEEDGWLQENPPHHYNVGTTSGDWYSGQLDQNGVPVSTMRDGTPKGYATINFKGNQYTFDYKATGLSSDQHMLIFSPKVVEKDKRTSAGIYVNFFIGSAEDKLEYRINEGEWETMTYVENYDPLYMHELHTWDFAEELLSGRRPSNPVNSKHLWAAPIPTSLPVGVHQIEVRATDMFGRTFIQKHSYRVAEREEQ